MGNPVATPSSWVRRRLDGVVRQTTVPQMTSTGNVNLVYRCTVNTVFACVVCCGSEVAASCSGLYEDGEVEHINRVSPVVKWNISLML